ncbi:ankyrin, partial [Nadsonia fulvescens var. elongata DSM 6958]
MSDKPRNLAFNSLPAISSSSSKSLKYDSRSSPPPRITHSPPRLKKVKSESLISSPVSQGKFSKFLNKSRKSSILALNTRSATATASTLPSPQFNSTNQLLFNPNKLKVHESFTNIQDEDFEQSSSKSRVKPRILNSTDKSSVLKDKTRHRIKKTTSDALKIHKLTSQNPKENKEKSKALDIFQDYKPKEPIGMENRHSSKKTNDTRAELVPTLPTSASASSLLKIFSSDNEDINSDRATDALIDSSEVETDIAESPKARYKSIKRQQKKKFCDNNENSQDSQEEEEKPRYNKTGHIHNLDYSSDLSPAPSSPTMNALYGEVPLIDDIGAEYDGEGEEEEDDKEKEENIEEEGKENKGEDEDEDEDEEINDEDKKNAHDKEPEKDEIKIKNEKEGMVEEIMEKDVEDIKLDIDNEDEESDEIFTNRSQYGQDNRSRQSQRQSEEKSQPREDSVPRRAIQGSATPNSNSRSVSPGIAISRRPNRKDRDANGRTKLMKMCDKGKFDEVEELLNLGASVNERDYAGSTALHEAALKGHRRIVRLLLDHNAIIDIRSGPDVLDTPLIDAASNDHLSTVKLLLSRGANPRVINARGQSAIDCVSDDMPNAREIRQLLKEASGKFRHYKETTDISSVPAGTFPDPARHGLNNHGTASSAKPRRSGARAQAMRNDLLWMDYASKGGREVLYDHASEGDIEYIGIALEGGYKPDAECLTLAAKHGHTDVVGLLLAFGAKPNALNEEGETALQQTIGRGHLKTVNLLLQSGADPYKADRCGKTCFDIVGSDDEEMDLLRSFSPKPDLANASTSTIMAKSASTSIPTQKTSSAVEIQKKYCYSDDFSDRKVKKRRLIQHSEFNDRNIDEEKSLKKNVEEDKLIKFKTGDSKAKYDDKASKRLAEDHKPDKETIDEEKFSPSPASLLTASIVSVSPVVTDNSVLYASTSSTNMTPACSSGLPLRGNPAT